MPMRISLVLKELHKNTEYADVNEIISGKVRSETGALPWERAICILNTNDWLHSQATRHKHYRIIIKQRKV